MAMGRAVCTCLHVPSIFGWSPILSRFLGLPLHS
jgi:hypothetical protein